MGYESEQHESRLTTVTDSKEETKESATRSAGFFLCFPAWTTIQSYDILLTDIKPKEDKMIFTTDFSAGVLVGAVVTCLIFSAAVILTWIANRQDSARKEEPGPIYPHPDYIDHPPRRRASESCKAPRPPHDKRHQGRRSYRDPM
jgi:hypothetical protein